MKRREELKAEGRYVEGPPQPQDHEKPYFPKYDDYEIMPGEEKKADRWEEYKNPYLKDDPNAITVKHPKKDPKE